MPTLTVRNLDPQLYADLKSLASAKNGSMEAEARDILREGVQQRSRWLSATLADLSGPPELAEIETPFVRSRDLPRDVEW